MGKIPDDWRKRLVVPVFKGKRGRHTKMWELQRNVAIMSYNMKIWEKIVEKRIRSETSIQENQFGFIPGKSTMKPLFSVRKIVFLLYY